MSEQEKAEAFFKLLFSWLHEHETEIKQFNWTNINIYASDDEDKNDAYHAVDVKVHTTPLGNEFTATGKLDGKE